MAGKVNGVNTVFYERKYCILWQLSHAERADQKNFEGCEICFFLCRGGKKDYEVVMNPIIL